MQTHRLTIVTTLAAASLAAACHSSSAPKATASSEMAAHFDSLAVAASAAGEFDRYRLLTYPIAFLAENGVPATVNLSVDGSSQSYQAGVVEMVGQTAGASPTPSDSIFVEFAWTGADVDQMVYAQIIVPDTLGDWADLVGDSANESLDSVTTAQAGVSATSAKCHTFSLPIVNAAAEDLLSGSTCTSGNMQAGFSLFFTPTTGFPNSSFVLASQSLPGIRLVLAQNNNGESQIMKLRSALMNHAKVVAR